MSWLDAAIEHSKGMGEGFSWETFGGRFFDSRRTRVYVPVKKGEIYLGLGDSFVFAQAQKVAHLLVKSVIDESLPIEAPLACNDWRDWPPGGRKYDAYLLGEIGHAPAIPNLIEAMLHDGDNNVREGAVKALMKIGGLSAVEPLCSCLSHDNDIYVSDAAAEALGKLGDIRASGALRNSFYVAKEVVTLPIIDENKSRTRSYWETLMESSLIALLKVDYPEGKKALNDGFSTKNPFVYHFVKRAKKKFEMGW